MAMFGHEAANSWGLNKCYFRSSHLILNPSWLKNVKPYLHALFIFFVYNIFAENISRLNDFFETSDLV